MFTGFLSFGAKHMLRAAFQPKNRMAELYNKSGDSWAVVSGGSDGIGFSMCQNLARQGFNICIAARNPAKIDEKLAMLKKECPNIKTMSLIADFGKLYTIKEYQEQIADKLKDVDVSVLILNAGCTKMNAFVKLEDQHCQDIVMINTLHPAYLSKVMAPQLNARFAKKGQKAAMVFVSSLASVVPSPGNLTYSATKSFCSYLGEGLSYEFEGKVDVINYMPSSVGTNLNPGAKSAGGDSISSAQSAEVCFRDLGIEPSTYGHWKHCNTAFLISMLPRATLARMSFQGVTQHLAKLEAEAKAKEGKN